MSIKGNSGKPFAFQMKEKGSTDITPMIGRLLRWPSAMYMPCIIPALLSMSGTMGLCPDD